MNALKDRNKIKGHDIILATIIILVVISCLIPFMVIVSASLSTEESILKSGYSLIPKAFSINAYLTLLSSDSTLLVTGYKTTIIVTTLGSILATLITLLGAYPLSRKRYKFRNQINLFVFITMLFNGGIVPWYIVTTQWFHLQDNYAALIIPYLANAWNLFLLRNFLAGIPDALEESAKIDGANNFRILFTIMAPLAMPGIATVFLFNTLTYWNDWWLGLMLINGNKILPLQLFLLKVMQKLDFLAQSTKGNRFASGGVSPTETVRMAICILVIGPIIFVYPFFQKYIVKGLLVGSVKG